MTDPAPARRPSKAARPMPGAGLVDLYAPVPVSLGQATDARPPAGMCLSCGGEPIAPGNTYRCAPCVERARAQVDADDAARRQAPRADAPSDPAPEPPASAPTATALIAVVDIPAGCTALGAWLEAQQATHARIGALIDARTARRQEEDAAPPHARALR